MRKNILGILATVMALVMIGSVVSATPVISDITSAPQYPVCAQIVTFNANVIDAVGVSNVRLNCDSSVSGHTFANKGMTGVGSFYSTWFNTDTINGETMVCSITATSTDNSFVTSDDFQYVYDCANPVSNAGADQIVNEGTSVSFDGSGSHDSGSGIASYSWTFGDGSTSSVMSPTHTYTDNGIYTASLTVTDHVGRTNSDSMTVTVNDLSPTAVLSGDTTLYQGVLGHWDASSSTSSPDAIVSYEWDWNYDGVTFVSSATGSVQSHTYNSYGNYVVAVRVTDDDGSTSIATLNVIVKNLVFANLPASKNDVINQPFIFDVDATDSNSLDTLTYSLVSNPMGMTIDPTTGVIDWTPNALGTYTANVSVSDGTESIYGILTVNVYDYKIDLTSGWNLISIPLVPEHDDTSINHVFGNIAQQSNVIWSYTPNATTGRNVWNYNQVVNGTETWDSNANRVQNIVPGYGYYVSMNSDLIAYENGNKMYGEPSDKTSPPVVQLTAGWNLVGHYGMNNVVKEDALTAFSGTATTLLDQHGNVIQTMNPTEGYWLFVNSINTGEYAPSNTDYA